MINEKDISRLKYLIKKGMKFNLKSPEHMIIYLCQQGFENIEMQEVVDLMKEVMLGD